jgi:hypothetical protein
LFFYENLTLKCPQLDILGFMESRKGARTTHRWRRTEKDIHQASEVTSKAICICLPSGRGPAGGIAFAGPSSPLEERSQPSGDKAGSGMLRERLCRTLWKGE